MIIRTTETIFTNPQIPKHQLLEILPEEERQELDTSLVSPPSRGISTWVNFHSENIRILPREYQVVLDEEALEYIEITHVEDPSGGWRVRPEWTPLFE